MNYSPDKLLKAREYVKHFKNTVVNIRDNSRSLTVVLLSLWKSPIEMHETIAGLEVYNEIFKIDRSLFCSYILKRL